MEFVNKLWPFRRGNDDIFQRSNKTETIYDALGTLPKHNYETELRMYMEGRWRRGFIQAVLPSCLLGGFLGIFNGIHQATYRNRHDPRPKVILSSIVGFAALGVMVSGSHQLLIVRNDYNDNMLFPLLSGMSGASIFATMNGVSPIYGGITGGFVGGLYMAICYGVRWFEERRIRNFLETHQQRQTPVHKVAPELQPLYRTFLFEYRPIEDSTELRRRAMLYTRDEKDMRIDTDSMFIAMQPEFVSWISFPEWWPIKSGAGDVEKQTLLNARRRDDEFTRRVSSIITEHSGVRLKHVFRTKEHVEDYIGNFDVEKALRIEERK